MPTTYEQSILGLLGLPSSLINGLQAYWKMGEASGTRYDSHGSNNLEDINTVGSTTGKIGNCAQFVGTSSEYLHIDDNASLSMGEGVAFAITGWIYPGSSTHATLIAKGGNIVVAANLEYAVAYRSVSAKFEFRISDGTTLTILPAITFGNVPDLNAWYFIYAYYDPATEEVGISVNNGSIDTLSAVETYAQDAGYGANVGRSGDSSAYYTTGKVDCLGVWKGRKLTAAEVTELYGLSEYPFISSGSALVGTVVSSSLKLKAISAVLAVSGAVIKQARGILGSILSAVGAFLGHQYVGPDLAWFSQERVLVTDTSEYVYSNPNPQTAQAVVTVDWLQATVRG